MKKEVSLVTLVEYAKTIEQKVDAAYAITTEAKKLDELVKPLKATIAEHAKNNEVTEVLGDEAKATVSFPIETYIPPDKLYRHMMKNNFSEKDFFKLVKVSVSEAQKFLGTANLKGISIFSNGSPRVSLKEM